MILPWWIDGAAKFVESFLNKDAEVFEWGSGRSTIWFAQRVKFIWTIEYQYKWLEKVLDMAQTDKLNNISICMLDNKDVEKYSSAIEQVGKKFDCVVVDGRNRVACMKKMMLFLKEKCVVVVDDTHRSKYFVGLELFGKDWNHSTFYDSAPKKNRLTKRTTVFWRG